jgi:hypothetical protein
MRRRAAKLSRVQATVITYDVHDDPLVRRSRSRSGQEMPKLRYSRRIAAWHEATTLKPGVATARVEPTPAKIGPTEPAEIEIATSVITAAEVVAGEAYVAAAGG